MKKYYLYSVMLSLFAFMSCDPVGTETYFVNNSSSHIIKVEWGIQPDRVDTVFMIDPGVKAITYVRSGMGIGGDMPAEYALTYLCRISYDTFTCKKAYGHYSDWETVKRKRFIKDYTLIISDSDF
jgi:hypothetical protein